MSPSCFPWPYPLWLPASLGSVFGCICGSMPMCILYSKESFLMHAQPLGVVPTLPPEQLLIDTSWKMRYSLKHSRLPDSRHATCLYDSRSNHADIGDLRRMLFYLDIFPFDHISSIYTFSVYFCHITALIPSQFPKISKKLISEAVSSELSVLCTLPPT